MMIYLPLIRGRHASVNEKSRVIDQSSYGARNEVMVKQKRSTHHRQPEYQESMVPNYTTALPQASRECYQCVLLFKIPISTGM